MAVQKSRKTPSKRGMHRSHAALKRPALSVDSQTGERLQRLRQQVDAGGLHKERSMADEADPDRPAVDPGRRAVGMGARHPFRPGLTLAAAPELPAQDFTERFRR